MPEAGPWRPLVSIVIPVYNGSDYLEEAVESALAQTYENKEVIVVNDGSNDEGRTEAVAKSFGDRIRYLLKENGGVASALNYGISKAKGEYISWLSHDDVYAEEKLQVQVDYLHNHPEDRNRIILYSNFYYIDEKSVVFNKYTLPKVPPEKLYQALLCEMTFRSPLRRQKFGVNGCTSLIPKDALEKVGFFHENLKTTQDFDMWFRLNKHYDFVQMDNYLLKSRIHGQQGIKTMKDIAQVEVNALFSRALDYYEKGSEKFDLELPKAALALRMSPRKKDASKRAMTLLRESGERQGNLGYYLFALLMTPTVAKTYSLFDRAMERAKSRRRQSL